MTQKSLGQVLYESEHDVPWSMATCHMQKACEHQARVVAAVVREQCAKEAKTHHEKMSKIAETRLVCPHEWDASEAIRSMK